MLAAMLLAGMMIAGQDADTQADAATPYVLFGRWPAVADCNPAIAASVDLADLLRDPAQWHDKCVAVKGYFYQRALFIDPDDTTLPHAAMNRASASARAGIYARDDVMDALYYRDQPAYVEVIGKAWDCRDLQGPDVVMVMGYCHYTGGPILSLTSFKPVREPVNTQEE